MPRTVLGKVSLTPRGAYSEEASYTALDLVSYNGSGYIALKSVQGVTPSNDDVNWMLLVSKGNTGETGPQGVSVVGAEINESGNLIITLDAGEPINAGSAVGPKGDTGDTGATGPQGASFTRLEKTAGTTAPGTVDTYTAYNSEGTAAGTIQVYNGADGTGTGDFKADGTVPMTGDLQVGAHKVTGMADGTADTDGATVGQLNVALEGKADADITGSEIPVSGTDSTTVEAALSNKADLTLSNLTNTQQALANLGSGVRPSYFTNGLFRVNQRGKSSYDGVGYAVDGLIVRGGGTRSVDYVPGQITCNWERTESQYCEFSFAIDPAEFQANKPLTFSILAKGTGVFRLRGFADGSTAQEMNSISTVVELTEDFNLYSVTFPAGTIPDLDSVSAIRMRMIADSSQSTTSLTGTITCIGAKAEPGLNQTIAYQDTDGTWTLLPQPNMDLGTQLTNCQALFCKSSKNNLSHLGGFIAAVQPGSTEWLNLSARFPVQMRKNNPTVTFTWLSKTTNIQENILNDSVTLAPGALSESGFSLIHVVGLALDPESLYLVQFEASAEY